MNNSFFNSKTLSKCQKILSMFEEMEQSEEERPRPQPIQKQYYIKDPNRFSSKNPSFQHGFASKSHKKRQSVSILDRSIQKKTLNRSMSQTSSISKCKYKPHHGKETRLDQIMRLKIKPSYKQGGKERKRNHSRSTQK